MVSGLKFLKDELSIIHRGRQKRGYWLKGS